MQSIYDKLIREDKLTDSSEYEIEIKAIYEDSPKDGTLIEAMYGVYKQKEFLSNEDTDWTKGRLFNISQGYIRAFSGSKAQLAGYPEGFIEQTIVGSGVITKKYLLNYEKSQPSGIVKDDNKEFANLKYMLATTVTIDEQSLGSGHDLKDWNENNKDNWFTSVSGKNNMLDLSGLNVGDKNGENLKFAGWKIKAGNNEISKKTYNDKIDFSQLEDGELWKAIFNNGEAILEAQWDKKFEAPETYVSIPNKIHLTNDTSNVKKVTSNAKTGGTYEKEEGYAGQKVTVKYKSVTDSATTTDLPNIKVEVEDEAKMTSREKIVNNKIDMSIGIYNTNGERIEGQSITGAGVSKYSHVGTLNSSKSSIDFWMNVKQPEIYEHLSNKYSASVSFLLTIVNENGIPINQ